MSDQRFADPDNAQAHSAGGRECRAMDRNTKSEQGTANGLLEPRARLGAIGTFDARVIITRASSVH